MRFRVVYFAFLAYNKQMAANTINKQNLLAAFAYFFGFVSGFLVLVLVRKNEYVRFHAAQSVVVFGLLFILRASTHYLPLFGSLTDKTLSVAGFVLWVFLLFKALRGERYSLPYLKDLARRVERI